MFKNAIQYLSQHEKLPPKITSYYVGIFYLIFFSIFLISCHFIPYVFDNNETFSNLIHAKNMTNFGIQSTYGLTDESYGNTAVSHPFVYTHQGNFPRFFAYFLYILGVHSVQWHIVITTFSIGLLGILFCNYFLTKNISPLFSCVFCTLLITDYIMFTQWQVNTWRVWQLFFFFSSMLCVQGLVKNRKIIFIPLCLLNFSCLTYTEISFACFVTLSCLFYVGFETKNFKKILLSTIILGLGCLVGMSILILQNLYFLGTDTFLADLKYTFFARNEITQHKQMIIEFYKSHKIVFWENFNANPHIRNPFSIIANFYHYCLLPYSPFLNLLAFSYFFTEIIKKYKVQLKPINIVRDNHNLFYLVTLLSGALLHILIDTYSPVEKILQILQLFGNLKMEWVLFSLFMIYLTRSPDNAFKSISALTEVNYTYLIIVCGITLITAVVLSIFNKINQPLSLQLIDVINHQFHTRFSQVLVYFFFLMYLYTKFNQQQSSSQKMFTPLFNYLSATLLAFFITFLIFPGYLFTGYLVRYCCFTVYAHTALFAWLMFNLLSDTIRYALNNEHSVFNKHNLYISLGLFIVVFYTWLHLQFSYVSEFSPTHFNFISMLQQKPLLHKNFAANNYAAPFAYMNHAWGYFDPKMAESTVISKNKKEHFTLIQDLRYLWLNDANTNQDYRSPDMFLCWIQYYGLDQFKQPKPKCNDAPLVQLARSANSKKYDIIEYAKDPSNEDKWSIMLLKPLTIPKPIQDIKLNTQAKKNILKIIQMDANH